MTSIAAGQSSSAIFIVELIAYDTTLDEDVRKAWTYSIPEDLSENSRFANMVIPPPPEKVAGLPRIPTNDEQFRRIVANRPVINMAEFHKVVPLSPEALLASRDPKAAVAAAAAATAGAAASGANGADFVLC